MTVEGKIIVMCSFNLCYPSQKEEAMLLCLCNEKLSKSIQPQNKAWRVRETC